MIIKFAAYLISLNYVFKWLILIKFNKIFMEF